MGTRTSPTGSYAWKTYNEIRKLAIAVGSGLFDLVQESEHEGRVFRFIGTLSKNREELYVTDLACAMYTYTNVPFYETLGPNTVEYILK
jgi:long-chain acyl-CoA synthetase